MSRVIPVVLAVAALVGVSACGGEDAAKQRNTYADQVNRAQTSFANSFKSLSRRISSTTTPARGRKTLQGFEDAVDASAAVAATSARSAKTAALAELLGRLDPDEVPIAVGFGIATPEQAAEFWRGTLGKAGLGADAPSWPGDAG